MAISIYITNQKAGKDVLYEKKKQCGKKRIVFLYRMFIANKSGEVTEFDVIRDSSVSIFGVTPKIKYGLHNECPPSKIEKPYCAHIRQDGKKGFRLELYEKGAGGKGVRYFLKGVGGTVRSHIQIHVGIGYSEGCFLLADGVKGRDAFQKIIERFILQDKTNKIKNHNTFLIRVQKR